MSMDGSIHLGTAYGDMQIDLTATERQFKQAIDKAEKGITEAMEQAGKRMQGFGENLTMLTAPLTALSALSVKVAKDFEYQFADVTKTVDATDERLKELYQTIRNMATDPSNPLSSLEGAHEQLALIMSLGGQLGIAESALEEFTLTIGALGVATNLTVEESATQIAQIANITGLLAEEYAQFGSALVQIGNNSATTERDIMNLAGRIALASTQVGISEQNILAFSAAISSSGISAELGGTNFSKFLNMITLATAQGGKELQAFARISGVSAEEFTRMWETDATDALMNHLLPALGQLNSKQRLLFFEEVNIKAMETQRVIDALAGNVEGLQDAWGHANAGWESGTAHIDEAQQKAETVQGALNRMNNTIRDVGISLGNALLPPLADVLDIMQPFIVALADLAERHPAIIRLVAGLSIGLTGLGVAFMAVGKAMTVASAVIQGAGLVLNPIGAIIAAITTGVVTLASIWRSNFGGLATFTRLALMPIKQIFEDINLYFRGSVQEYGYHGRMLFSELVENTKANIQEFGRWIGLGANSVKTAFHYLRTGDQRDLSRLERLKQFGEQGVNAVASLIEMRKRLENTRNSINKVGKAFEYVGDALKIIITGEWKDTFDGMYETFQLIPGSFREFFYNVHLVANRELTSLSLSIRRHAGILQESLRYLFTGNNMSLIAEGDHFAVRLVTSIRTMFFNAMDSLPNLLASGTEVVNRVASGLGEIIRMGVEKIPDLLILGADILPKLLGALFAAKPIIKGWIFENVIVPIGTEVLKGLGTVTSTVGDWGPEFINTLGNSIKVTAEWVYERLIAPFVDSFSDVIKNARSLIEELANNIASTVKENAPKVFDAFTNLTRDVSERLGSFLADFLITVGGLVADIIPIVIEWGPKILGAIFVGFRDIGVWIWHNILSPFIKGFTDKFPELLNVGLAIVAEIIKGLGNAAIAVYNEALNLGGEILAGIGDALSGLGDWLHNNLIVPILQKIEEAKRAIQTFFFGTPTEFQYQGVQQSQSGGAYMYRLKDKGGVGKRGGLYHVGQSQIGHEAFIAGDNGHFYPDFARELANVASSAMMGGASGGDTNTTIHVTVNNPSGGYNAGSEYGRGLADELARKLKAVR